jgi:hypothetical protein
VSFAAITLCVASQRVFIVVGVCFVIDSVRKHLDTTSYFKKKKKLSHMQRKTRNFIADIDIRRVNRRRCKV